MSIKKYLPKLLRQDKSLAKLFRNHGHLPFQPKLERTPYETLCRAIAHQQLHGKAAETILGRMIAHFGGVFPSPEKLAATKTPKLRAFGFSNNKAKALKDIAKHALSGHIPTTAEIQKLSDEEIINRLTPIYGVGRWTVEMLLIFQLGRMDVWPVDDFGVRNGYRHFRKLKTMPTAKEMRAFDTKWRPYRTVVALYLWREADNKKPAAKPVLKKKSAKKSATA